MVALYKRIARDAARYHGPYRVEVALQQALGAGKTATAAIRVLSAAGVAVPDVHLALTAAGAAAVPSTARTNANGVATVQVKAVGAGGVHLTASAEMPATAPRIFRPTSGAAAANGQRLAAAEIAARVGQRHGGRLEGATLLDHERRAGRDRRRAARAPIGLSSRARFPATTGRSP